MGRLLWLERFPLNHDAVYQHLGCARHRYCHRQHEHKHERVWRFVEWYWERVERVEYGGYLGRWGWCLACELWAVCNAAAGGGVEKGRRVWRLVG